MSGAYWCECPKCWNNVSDREFEALSRKRAIAMSEDVDDRYAIVLKTHATTNAVHVATTRTLLLERQRRTQTKSYPQRRAM